MWNKIRGNLLCSKALVISIFWLLVFGSNQHRGHLLASGFPFRNQLVAVINRADNEHRRLRVPLWQWARVQGRPSALTPRTRVFLETQARVGWEGQWQRVGFVSQRSWSWFTNSRALRAAPAPHTQLRADLNPSRSKRLTFSSYLYSGVWKKEKSPSASALPPCALPPSHGLAPSPLPHSVPERQTEPDNICSSQHRLISLHTSSERLLSRGVWDISPLRRVGSGTSAANRGESLGSLGGPVTSGLGWSCSIRRCSFTRSSCMSTSQSDVLWSSGAWMKAERWGGENAQPGCWQPGRRINPCFVWKAKFG